MFQISSFVLFFRFLQILFNSTITRELVTFKFHTNSFSPWFFHRKPKNNENHWIIAKATATQPQRGYLNVHWVKVIRKQAILCFITTFNSVLIFQIKNLVFLLPVFILMPNHRFLIQMGTTFSLAMVQDKQLI